MAASGGGVHAGVDHREVERQQIVRQGLADELAAEQHAEQDGGNGQALDPAVGLDELRVRQQFGQDAVFGRRVGGGAEADDGIRDQRVHAEQHHQAADHLDEVREEHHLALGQGVGDRAHEGGQDHVEQREHRNERGALPFGAARSPDQLHRRDEQRVVGERAEELRRHDGVEALFHAGKGQRREEGFRTRSGVWNSRMRRRNVSIVCCLPAARVIACEPAGPP